jgi:hypothetical protein
VTKYFLLTVAAALISAASDTDAVASSLLWDQTQNFNLGQPIISVNTDNGDTAAADDFTVPSGQTWQLSEVDVLGAYFNGSGPATSEVVTFYKNKRKRPGVIQAGPFTIKCDGATGVFFCTLPKTVKLKSGAWWVSVVANCNFDTCGQWGWTTNTRVQGNQANYRSSFAGSRCPNFKTVRYCLKGGSVDMAFQMWGTAKDAK